METTLLSVGSMCGSKEMSSQATKRHGGKFIAYYKVKGGNLKVYILYDFSYMTFWEGRLYRQKKSPWLPEVERDE